MVSENSVTRFIEKTFFSLLTDSSLWKETVKEISELNSRIKNLEKETKQWKNEKRIWSQAIESTRQKNEELKIENKTIRRKISDLEKSIASHETTMDIAGKPAKVVRIKPHDNSWRKKKNLLKQLKIQEVQTSKQLVFPKFERKKPPTRDFLTEELSSLLEKKNRIYQTTLSSVIRDLKLKKDKVNLKIDKLKNFETFLNEQLEFEKFFDKLFKYPLTDSQRRAILTENDRTLVVASAGAGKTSTLIGKYAYLIESKKAKEEEILVLAFNKSVQEEIEHKLQKLGYENNFTKTFNGLGSEILNIAKIPNAIDQPSISETDRFKLTQIIDLLIDKAIEVNPNYMQNYLEFCATCPNDLKATFAENKEEYDDKISKYPYRRDSFALMDKFRALHIPCLDGKTWVRSQQELFIANTLFINGIDFIYEKPLVKESITINPDFYFPEINCWYEHYAVDLSGKSPFGEDYEIGHVKKEEFYESHNLDHFSTNLYDYKKGNIEEKIFDELKKRGIERNLRSQNEIEQSIQEIYKDNVKQLLGEMILHFKESNLSKNEFLIEIERLDDQTRAQKFRKIFIPLLEAYQNRLRTKGTIDFSDQIIKAIDILEKNTHQGVKSHLNLKYLLIDEFQDLSKNRGKLIEAILALNPESKLFGVGDDWQSIYRFSGSDISFVTNFKNKFFSKNSSIKFIGETHRFPEEISNVASRFIQRNPEQLPKIVKTTRTGGKISFCEIENYKIQSIKRVVDQIERGQGEKKVFILWRVWNDVKEIQEDLEDLAKSRPDLHFEHGSIHKAKGLEWDIVILIGMDGGMFGFPRLIPEDSLKTMLLPKEENYPNAEERRVMYVALTRAKEQLFLVSAPGKDRTFYEEPSEFFFEIEEICEAIYPENNGVFEKLDFVSSIPCPECKKKKINQKMMIKSVRKTEKNIKEGLFPSIFMGCSGFTTNKESAMFCNHISNTVNCPNCLLKGQKGVLKCEVITDSLDTKYLVKCNKCLYEEDYFYFHKNEETTR